jgi:hypothetical protein
MVLREDTDREVELSVTDEKNVMLAPVDWITYT